MMSTTDNYVCARIDSCTKKLASQALKAISISVSYVIRLLMIRIAEERQLPLIVQAPNLVTLNAIEELELGKGKRSNNQIILMN